MSQRAAAVRVAAAPLHPPSPPLTLPLCLGIPMPAHQPSMMPPTQRSTKHLHLLPYHLHLQGRPHPLHLQPHPPTTQGRSAGSAASSGSQYRRRRCAGNPTSGRWRCGSSSTRSMCAPWRSCSASRRRRRQAYVRQHQLLEPYLVSPDPALLRRVARMRWVLVTSLKTDTSNRKFVLTATKGNEDIIEYCADSNYTPILMRLKWLFVWVVLMFYIQDLTVQHAVYRINVQNKLYLMSMYQLTHWIIDTLLYQRAPILIVQSLISQYDPISKIKPQ